MLQVTSTLRILDGRTDEALAVAREHVARSRNEDGCVRHDIFQAPDDPQVFFFFERWRDRAALDLHFQQPGSVEFVGTLAGMLSEPPELQICEVRNEQIVPVG